MCDIATGVITELHLGKALMVQLLQGAQLERFVLDNRIGLSNNFLIGTLPEKLANLEWCLWIDLSNNLLKGLMLPLNSAMSVPDLKVLVFRLYTIRK
jgi:hypothetical protein